MMVLRSILSIPTILLGQAFAAGWCPTSTDNTITCSNCSIELTCDVSGIGITISGSNVIFDGQWHYFGGFGGSQSPIRVMNNGGLSPQGSVTIKNLYMSDLYTGHPAILFSGPPSFDWSYVENVYINQGMGGGIAKLKRCPLEIRNSYMVGSGTGTGVSSWETGTNSGEAIYTDFINSYAITGRTGYEKDNDIGSWIRNSYFWGNFAQGVYLNNSVGTWIDSGYFYDNSKGYSMGAVGVGGGLLVTNSTVTASNNSGEMNGGHDCVMINTTNWGANNQWHTYSGSACSN